MTELDVPEMASLMATTDTWTRYGVTLESASRTLMNLLQQANDPEVCECIVAEDEIGPAGFLVLQHDAVFGMSSYVKLVGVREDVRSRGCGKSLILTAEQLAFARGPNIFLLTSDFNHRAMKFYENLGYQRAGVIKDYVIKGIDEILYRKTRGPIRNPVTSERGSDF
jgi:ribosomal protein S18 acetylase RimI-like enzyme